MDPMHRSRNLLPGNGDLRSQQDREMGFCEFKKIRPQGKRTKGQYQRKTLLPLSYEDGDFGFGGLKNHRGNGKLLPIDLNPQRGNRGQQERCRTAPIIHAGSRRKRNHVALEQSRYADGF